MKIEDFTEPLSDALKNSLQDLIADATQPQLTEFTLKVAARTVKIAAVADKDERAKLMKEHKGTLRTIAEAHRINLAENANQRLNDAVELASHMLFKLADSAT